MTSAIRFAKEDWIQACKFTFITWICYVLIYIGQTSFRPSTSILLMSILVLPALFSAVFIIRGGVFMALFLANDRNFHVAYSKLRNQPHS